MGDRTPPGCVRRLRGDDGLSVSELLVTLSLTSILAAWGLSFLVSFTRHDERIDDRDLVAQEVAHAHTVLVADANRADSVGPIVASEYDTNLPLLDSTTGELVVWRLEDDALVRYSNEAGTLVGQVMVEDVLPTLAAFHYYGPDGAEIDPTTVAAATMTYCTTRVRVALDAEAGTDTMAIARDLAFRARQPGTISC